MSYTPIWAQNKEKLNKTELIKLEKDGLDVIEDIYRYAKTGFESITPDDMDRFKWAGVYQQRPKDGCFMMRVRVPSGNLTSEQARTLASIAHDYGRDLIDITTRQAIQFHWLRIENLPDIFERLAAVGLSSFEACGDCPRTIVGNPLAGLDPYELIDTTPLVKQLSDTFLMNRDFSNLPRKYKISISSNIYNAGHAEINDLAFTPATKVIAGKEIIGFHVWVGGGLSSRPYLAQQLDVFVRPEEVVKVAVGVTTIFRDYGYREKRHHARLKFLVADWGAEKFLAKLKELVGELETRGEDKIKGWNAGYFTGIHKQRQEGLSYVGLSVPVGRMSAQELEELAHLADEYGNGSLRTCNSQNIIITGIPDERVEELLQEKVLERLTPYPKNFTAFAVSCTGNEFCNLAIVETKERMRQLAEYLDEHVELDEPIRMHMVGCPNSCGQRQIADIGFQGALVKTEDGMKDAFDIFLGGTLGPNAKFNEKLKGRVLGEQLHRVVLPLLAYYKEEKRNKESFFDFVQRVGITPFQERLDAALKQLV
ncbi:nitrite/sulfite reductase [Aneurinibacillus thermoaerophilus]|uniref:Ferredoxin-nitrite reductase n=1 Tax=Aneurinibacillus thermoaerophilus TaxID=143495 RepID=A0A1G8A7Q8_ANETH|nr:MULTISPECIES: ferredoxin--nitrite reductase [Aneurinibacillus]AMA74091.1 ferredoxin--nitrite reductase [Aneurinibacillus sp. XH2]MED0675467.1 nitrite/sulfite reductase [Aneurinibacillus thermoaerophilus]MED0678822.1 nitrite/sulfite reductase [Aneurinibacillus thermoaerophilus]MED0758350.1 nitrite/sulfite reductase [Aneurinibacillus thermoaerophilus]MED0759843.1 nitrite/sulfite reductase [Aneurinibacillus thermoaerophilus]